MPNSLENRGSFRPPARSETASVRGAQGKSGEAGLEDDGFAIDMSADSFDRSPASASESCATDGM